MCSLFRNKYRIETCHLKGHDYSSGGKYFITINTQGKTPMFGYILNHKMFLSESGQIAKKNWCELPEHFSFISLDEFVVMPDHVHGIIIINSGMVVRTIHAIDERIIHVMDVETLHGVNVETLHATSLPRPRNTKSTTPPNTKNEFMSSISPKPGSLSSVIRSYKSAVSKNVRRTIPDFSWQRRFYDHLIHFDTELDRIREYIIDNPINWESP